MKNNCGPFTEEELCSGNGECICNKCKCNSTDYFGHYCEKSQSKDNKLCLTFKSEVRDFINSDEDVAMGDQVIIQMFSNKTDYENFEEGTYAVFLTCAYGNLILNYLQKSRTVLLLFKLASGYAM